MGHFCRIDCDKVVALVGQGCPIRVAAMGYLQFTTGTFCALVSSSVVPTAERCVLVWLAAMTAPGDELAHVTVTGLAEAFRVDRRTAGRWLRTLEDAGMIRRGRGWVEVLAGRGVVEPSKWLDKQRRRAMRPEPQVAER
jgi:DNA-binding transcriptional ArsR family regulator